MHLGFAHDLLNGKCSKELDHEGNSAGVCIFDCGAKNRFGGGKLQDYQVSSTYPLVLILLFIRLIVIQMVLNL